MSQILLMGLVVIVVYLASHYGVMAIESSLGRELGLWRSVIFFVLFLMLILAAGQLLPGMFGGGRAS